MTIERAPAPSLLLFILLALSVSAVHAQQTGTPSPAPPARTAPAPAPHAYTPGMPPRDASQEDIQDITMSGTSYPTGLSASMRQKMAFERNQERQKKIVANSAHILELAKKLNADVAKSNKNELSLSVINEAEEIEKLAKTVKKNMQDVY